MNGVKWIFPTAPTQHVSAYGDSMPSWFDISEAPRSAQTPNFEEDVLKAVSSVHGMIDEEVKAGTPPDRIFLRGFSQGGALCLASAMLYLASAMLYLASAMLYPEKLAGAAVFSGCVPSNPDFIEKIPANAKQTKVLWAHGTSDEVVPFSEGQAALPLLERAGVHLEFKAYPGVGHSISDEQLLYLESWFGRAAAMRQGCE